jgi:hypothetical protein
MTTFQKLEDLILRKRKLKRWGKNHRKFNKEIAKTFEKLLSEE